MNRHVSPHELDRQGTVPADEPLGPSATFRDFAEDESAVFVQRSPDFSSARRHSRRVRWVKRLLPLSIVVAVVAIGAVSVLSRLKLSIELPFDIGHLTLTGSRLTMELPKLSGFTDDNRGYRVTARTATQDLTHPDVIDLTDIEARLEMSDKGWASVSAKVGSFDTKKQFITLGDGVDLAMNGGYGGRLHDAEVDVKAGTIATEKPVVFTYLDGKLVADRLHVGDRGTRALFEGNVQLDFRMSNLPGQKPDAAAKAAACL
ncbi:hypothetical protein K9U40_15655 [Xanthobacter autotrophicus]|uniref:hypothetical protein n=1 Tax=Xanthobacter autotrophicus TaxID=280 RepID=UPI0024ABED9B|nr:hypothetical protein [Xanthobacter autotrophicus]MDI4665746.1 hypothetical protein [Xanthobacter autotrophicus]